MLKKFRFFLNVNKVRNATEIIAIATEKNNPKVVDYSAKYIVKHAKRAIKLSEEVKGVPEKPGIVKILKKIVQSYENPSSSLKDSQQRDSLKIQNLESITNNDSKVKITKEQVLKDLQKIGYHFSSIGEGTENDRAAQLVIQSLEVAYRRLEKPKQLKLLYFDMGMKNKLPPVATSILERYSSNKIDLQQAQSEFKGVIKEYLNVFAEQGINPAKISGLFEKSPQQN